MLGAGLDDQGKFTGNGALNLYAANLSNAGTIQATGDVTLGLSGVLANQGTGVIEAGQAATLPPRLSLYNAAQATNAGSLAAQGALAANIASGHRRRRQLRQPGHGERADGGGQCGQPQQYGHAFRPRHASGFHHGRSQQRRHHLGPGAEPCRWRHAWQPGGGQADRRRRRHACGQAPPKTLTNAGSVSAGGKLAATATDLTNTGQMTAAGDASFNVTGTLANDTTGKIHADGALSHPGRRGQELRRRGRHPAARRDLGADACDQRRRASRTRATCWPRKPSPSTPPARSRTCWARSRRAAYLSITAAGNLENLSGLIQGADVSINAQTIENVTLVRRGSELIIPEEFTGVLRVETSQAVNKAVLGFWGISLNPSGSPLVTTLLTEGWRCLRANGGSNGPFIEPGTAATGAHTDMAAQQAEISATGGVKLNAAKDINNVGGKLAAANGDLSLNAGGDINVDAQALSSAQGSVSTVSHVKSTLSAGGNVTINAGGDATIKAADVTSGKNTTIAAGGQVTLGAAQDEYHEHSSHKSCTWYGSCKTSVINKDNLTVVATSINSGGWVEIESKTKDILTTATTVNAAGSIKLLSDLGNVLLEAGENSTYSQSYTKKSYVFGLFGSASGSTDSTTTIAPTFVSAVNDVRIVSHADFVLKGSGVQAGGSIFVDAQNVQILAMQNLSYHQDITEKWGFFADSAANTGTASVTFAWQDTQDRQATSGSPSRRPQACRRAATSPSTQAARSASPAPR